VIRRKLLIAVFIFLLSIASDSQTSGVTEVISVSNSVTCREDFFLNEETGFCVPSCDTWREYSDSEVVVTDVLILSANVIGFIAGVLVLVISVISYERM
jgi:hypothetical protein